MNSLIFGLTIGMCMARPLDISTEGTILDPIPVVEEVVEEENYEEIYEITVENAVEEDYEEPEIVEEADAQWTYTWSGSVLNWYDGVNYGPTGKETYYNLPMDGVVWEMRKKGYSEADYPVWVRDDGVKMFGNYVMVAANLNHFPYGTIVECSLGTAIVVDTGGFASWDEGWNWLDIATTW